MNSPYVPDKVVPIPFDTPSLTCDGSYITASFPLYLFVLISIILYKSFPSSLVSICLSYSFLNVVWLKSGSEKLIKLGSVSSPLSAT